MGAARHAPPPIPVARVLKQGSLFVCGICRKPHMTKEQGNACVNNCFANFTSGELVQVTKQWGRDSFRCKLCTRTYAQLAPAQTCAADCKARMQQKLPPMPRVTAGGGFAPQPDAPARKPIVRAVAAAKPKAPAPRPTVVADAGPQMADAAPTPEAAPAPKRPPRDRTKKFHRDGARYVCQECGERFFTKVEVEACFDKHPD